MEGSGKEKISDSTKYERRVKIEVFGEEQIEKIVKLSGRNGRIYLPQDWVNHQVKIIRVD